MKKLLIVQIAALFIIFLNGCSKSNGNTSSLFFIELNGKDGCIDSTGKIIIEPRFEALY